jgi:hypothetical protein
MSLNLRGLGKWGISKSLTHCFPREATERRAGMKEINTHLLGKRLP